MRKFLTDWYESTIIGELMGKRKKNKRNRKGSKIIVRKGNNDMTIPAKTGGSNVFGVQTKAAGQGCGCGPANTTRTGTVQNGVVRGASVYPNRGVVTPAAPTFWETDIEVETVKSCGVFNTNVNIFVEAVARNKMQALMKAYDKIEWLAYLVGDKETNTVTDIVIPKQRVTAVNVYVDEPVDVPIIGVIHSHHDMGNGFSHTDDDYINQNHDISLCITNVKITGQVRMKTECGRFFLADAVVVEYDERLDTTEFLKDADKMISRLAYVNRTAGNVGGHRVGGGVGLHSQYGNAAGWEDYMNMEEEAWDTEVPAVSASKSRDLLAEVEAYRESINGQTIDQFYLVEFSMLSNLIDSIGSTNFMVWEEKAFDTNDNVYTEDYYRLVDEISLFEHQLTNQEKMALKGLGDLLDKIIETNEGDESPEVEEETPTVTVGTTH